VRSITEAKKFVWIHLLLPLILWLAFYSTEKEFDYIIKRHNNHCTSNGVFAFW